MGSRGWSLFGKVLSSPIKPQDLPPLDLAMLLFPCPQPPTQAAPPTAQVYAQGGSQTLPQAMEALIKAKDWAGLADWFETVSPPTRGAYYEWWIQSLNRSQRWERLVVVCEALQPQLEAKSGPRLGTYRLYRAQALGRLGRHSEAALAHAENGRLGLSEGLANACTEARLAQDWNGLLSYSNELLQKHPQGRSPLQSGPRALRVEALPGESGRFSRGPGSPARQHGPRRESAPGGTVRGPAPSQGREKTLAGPTLLSCVMPSFRTSSTPVVACMQRVYWPLPMATSPFVCPMVASP